MVKRLFAFRRTSRPLCLGPADRSILLLWQTRKNLQTFSFTGSSANASPHTFLLSRDGGWGRSSAINRCLGGGGGGGGHCCCRRRKPNVGQGVLKRWKATYTLLLRYTTPTSTLQQSWPGHWCMGQGSAKCVHTSPHPTG